MSLCAPFRLGARSMSDDDRLLEFTLAVKEEDLDGLAGQRLCSRAPQIVKIVDRLAVAAEDHVARRDAGRARRSRLVEVIDQEAARVAQSHLAGDLGGHLADADAEPGAGTPFDPHAPGVFLA